MVNMDDETDRCWRKFNKREKLFKLVGAFLPRIKKRLKRDEIIVAPHDSFIMKSCHL